MAPRRPLPRSVGTQGTIKYSKKSVDEHTSAGHDGHDETDLRSVVVHEVQASKTEAFLRRRRLLAGTRFGRMSPQKLLLAAEASLQFEDSLLMREM